MNREFIKAEGVVYWSVIRLETSPGRPSEGWPYVIAWVHPGPVQQAFLMSGLPAFWASSLTVHGLGLLGINEVITFFIFAPVLLTCWYFFVGWMLDRWLHKRATRLASS